MIYKGFLIFCGPDGGLNILKKMTYYNKINGST